METQPQRLSFPGALLQRGFWLYVWEITTADDHTVLYVGRTGDSGSPNAQSPFNRLSQHLGFNIHQNMLRKHLNNAGITPEDCHFDLFSYGPILPECEDNDWDAHRACLRIIAPLEKALCDELQRVGYQVLNTVRCRNPLDPTYWESVRTAFAEQFPSLR